MRSSRSSTITATEKASKAPEQKSMASGSQVKATFDGLNVVITMLNQSKRIGLSDFDRQSLEILYGVWFSVKFCNTFSFEIYLLTN